MALSDEGKGSELEEETALLVFLEESDLLIVGTLVEGLPSMRAVVFSDEEFVLLSPVREIPLSDTVSRALTVATRTTFRIFN